MVELARTDAAVVYHADWKALLDVVPKCDALIVDAPYSERTHAGHDDGTDSANRLTQERLDACCNSTRQDLGLRPIRRPVDYAPWTAEDVNDFVVAWGHRVRGWFVSITDHVLAPIWDEALSAEGRYIFAPLPFVAPGSRVRLAGDGPSNWTTWIVVARPRSKEFSTWGTLPGAYVLPEGQGGAMPVVGGKPVWLLESLVRDYSRPGNLCVDPCCGSGSLAVGAIRRGRRAIVGDSMLAHAQLAALWIRNPNRKAPSLESGTADEAQRSLFGGRSQTT